MPIRIMNTGKLAISLRARVQSAGRFWEPSDPLLEDSLTCCDTLAILSTSPEQALNRIAELQQPPSPSLATQEVWQCELLDDAGQA
ncbi:hypothetical protein KIM372_12260 [Bombiscardovia nodaiensis]|uniref:Uncharacterized protein n=1 Tax=Bombiscardovia nodaiensis TaxID=2932181 RepID=A0ABN6SCP8_9BIFI|nr:hypothetical protein KIM372_12260 [Bombiscardovia nodaiensis]